MSEIKKIDVQALETTQEIVEDTKAALEADAPDAEHSGLSKEFADLEANANKMIDDPDYDPMAGPLMLFGLYCPRVVAAISELSNKQLRRLLKAIITYPLENIEVNKKNELEFELYKMCNKLLEAKYLLMMVNAEQDRAKREAETKQAQEQSTEQVSSVSTEENKPE